MGAADYLLSPRRNHRGTETPSEASRILFLVTLGCASVWAWPIADGLVFVWFCLVLFVSTPILSSLHLTTAVINYSVCLLCY